MATMHAVHRCLGLAVGALVCVLGLTGSLLVFRTEIERLVWPELFNLSARTGRPASLEEMRSLAMADLPNLDLYRVRLAHDGGEPYEFILGNGGKLTHHVYIDAHRRRITGIRTAGSDPVFWLQSLHFDLLAGQTGRQVNGYVAASVLLLGCSGLLLWFHGRCSWKARLKPLFRVRPARRNWGIHVAFGFWSFSFLALIASTALYFSFHDGVAKFVYWVTRSKEPAPFSRLPSSEARVALDVLLANARGLEPEAQFTTIRLPRFKGLPITLNYLLPGDLSDLGGNAIDYNPATGTMLRWDRLRDREAGPRIVAAFPPLHFGRFGGLPTRILWAHLGLLPSILYITGLAIWRRRRASHRLRNRPAGQKQFQSAWEVQDS